MSSCQKIKAVFNHLSFIFLLITILSLTLITSSFFIPSGLSLDPEYIIDGDVVFIDNAQCRIAVYPHIVTGSGYAYLNVTSKQYSGEVDFVFGFDTDIVKPKKLDIYKPHNVTHSKSLESFFNTSDYEVKYNYTIYESPIAYDGYIWVYELSPNGTHTSLTYEHHFDAANIQTKMIYWNTLVLWKKISDDIHLRVIKHQFGDVDTWYKGKANVTAGVEYHSRYYLEIAPKLGEHSGKYWVAFKPHSKTLREAIQDDVFYYLDPWFNISFLYRKSHNITGTTVTNASDVFSEDFEDQTFNKWDDNGATVWTISDDYAHGETYSAKSDSTTMGDLISDNITLSDSVSDGGFECWIYKTALGSGDWILYFWNGSSYVQIVDLDTIGSDDAWLYYSTNLNSTYWISDFHVKYTTQNLGVPEDVYLDDVIINMTHTVGLTNYPMKIITHFGNGSDSGADVYLLNHSQTDFDDVRFTNETGSALDYYREKYTESDNAAFWVEIDYIPGSPNNVTIWIYYGNEYVSTTSNGYDTFPLFFDDFSDGDYTNNPTWNVQDGLWDASNHWLRSTSGDIAYHDISTNQPEAYGRFGWKCKLGTTSQGGVLIAFIADIETWDPDNGYCLQVWRGGTLSLERRAGTNTLDTSPWTPDTNWHDVEITRNSTGWFEVFWDGVLVMNATDNLITASAYFINYFRYTDDAVDEIRIGSYVDPEPTHRDWSDEERLPLLKVTFFHDVGGTFRVDNVTLPNSTENFYDNESVIELIGIAEENSTFKGFTWDSNSNTSNPSLLLVITDLTVWCHFETVFLVAARFNTTITTAYLNETIFFDASMSNSTEGNITDYSWDFGDGNVTSGNYPNITHSWSVYWDLLNEPWNSIGTWVQSGAGTAEIDPAGQLHLDLGATTFIRLEKDIGSVPDKYIMEFLEKIDVFGWSGHHLIGYEKTLQFNIYSDKISIKPKSGGDINFFVDTDTDWHIWRLEVDCSGNCVEVYRDDIFIHEFTNDIFETQNPGSDGGIGTYVWQSNLGEKHQDYWRIGTVPPIMSFTINLIVTDSNNKTDSFSQTINITEYNNPSARFNSTITGFVDEVIILNGSISTDTDGIITNYAWNFGDGNITSGNYPNITHSWNSTANYTIILTVTDSQGLTDSYYAFIIIVEPVERGEYMAVSLAASLILVPLLICVIYVLVRRKH